MAIKKFDFDVVVLGAGGAGCAAAIAAASYGSSVALITKESIGSEIRAFVKQKWFHLGSLRETLLRY